MEIKKNLFAFFIFCLICVCENRAQTVLLQVDRQTDSIQSTRGPNLDKFSHGFFYFGFIAGAYKPGARIIYGPSVEFGGGVRKKYKVSSFYSPGWELGINEKIFKLDQQAEKKFPDTLLNDVERMEFSSLYASFYNRFNFDAHRGNFMGTFLDLGISAEWDFEVTHVIKNTLPDGSKIKSQLTHLPYVNHFNYSVFARMGRSHVSVYASFRLSDFWKTSYNYPELPVLSIGAEVGIFRQ